MRYVNYLDFKVSDIVLLFHGLAHIKHNSFVQSNSFPTTMHTQDADTAISFLVSDLESMILVFLAIGSDPHEAAS